MREDYPTLVIVRPSGIDTNGITALTNLTNLYFYRNNKITDIDHMTGLHTLIIGDGISNNGLDKLTNLTYLDIDDNRKVTDINNLVNLRTLRACGKDCRIDNNGFRLLTNLTSLFSYDNKNITIKI